MATTNVSLPLSAMLAQDLRGPLEAYFENDRYAVEQKLDGHRILLHIDSGNIAAVNRHGKVSQHNARMQVPTWAANALPLQGRYVIFDGELINNTLYVFDLPQCEGVLNPKSSFTERRQALESLFGLANFNERLQLVISATTTDDKLQLFRRCVDAHAEGLIIRDRHAPYRSGRSKELQKLKFTHSADLVVTEIGRDGKNNAILSAYYDAELLEVGKCSLLGKESVEIGDVVEVKYLYLSDENRIVQPRMKFRRDDKDASDCLFDQLRSTDKKVVVTLDR